MADHRCSTCGYELEAHGRYCGRCGTQCDGVIQPFHAGSAIAGPAPVPIVLPAADPLELAADLEIQTRMNPLMNRERLKAAVMRTAARRGRGAVGYWCDD